MPSLRPGIAQKRFSRDRFQPLTDTSAENVPLAPVTSNVTGARQAKGNVVTSSAYVPPTELGDEKPSSQPAGRRIRGALTVDGHSLETEDDGKVNKMGKFYQLVMSYSVLTRYFVYVLPVALVIAIPIIVGATVAPKAKIAGVRIVWFFTWIEVLWVSLWVSKCLSHYLPFVFQFLIGIVNSGTRKYALILTSLQTPIALVGWSVTALATFLPIMTQNPDQMRENDTATKDWEAVMRAILFATFLSSLILAGEKLIVQLISISYHRKQFDFRIKDSKRNIALVTLLYEASRALFPPNCPEFEEEDGLIDIAILPHSSKIHHHFHQRHGSSHPMRMMRNVRQNVSGRLQNVIGNVAQELTGKQMFNSGSAHSIVSFALEKAHCAEALARRLWMSFVLNGRDSLYLDDIIDVLGPGREKDAHECFEGLDRDGNGDISLEEMILTIIEYGRIKKSINSSLHDVDQAINVLDNLLMCVGFVFVVMVYVSFLNKSFGSVLAAGATTLLSLSFVFAVSAQEVLGSCIFLFVKHPYDVGDRVDINGKLLVVDHVSLLYTVFWGVEDRKSVQVPNIVLNSVWIENVTRSRAMRERITIPVDISTSFEDIQLLKQEMHTFAIARENARDFEPDIEVWVHGVGELNRLELCIEVDHKSNWANETVRTTRRNKLFCALIAAIRRIPIASPGFADAIMGDANRPSYMVSLPPVEAQGRREAFLADKAGKRLATILEQERSSSEQVPTPTQPQQPQSLDSARASGANPRVSSSSAGLSFRAAAGDASGPNDFPSSASVTAVSSGRRQGFGDTTATTTQIPEVTSTSAPEGPATTAPSPYSYSTPLTAGPPVGLAHSTSNTSRSASDSVSVPTVSAGEPAVANALTMARLDGPGEWALPTLNAPGSTPASVAGSGIGTSGAVDEMGRRPSEKSNWSGNTGNASTAVRASFGSRNPYH